MMLQLRSRNWCCSHTGDN